MHGCCSLPSETDGNPHTQLPLRLAHFGPVAGGFDIPQDPPPLPLRLPGTQGQLCQERTVTQSGIVPGYSYRLGADDSYCLSGASHHNSIHNSQFNSRKALPIRSKLSRRCWAEASPVLRLGLRSIQFWLKQRVLAAAWPHGRHRIMVTRACVSALTRWRNPLWLTRGVPLDRAHRRNVVTTDTSNKGWGALCEGKPTFGL